MGVREITAEEAAKRRAKALKKDAPSSGFVRDFAEGAATAGGRLVDAINSFPLAMGYTGGREYEPVSDVENFADRISNATAEDPTRARAAGAGVGGALMSLPVVAATGGLSVPLTVSTLAGGAGGGLASDEARRRGYGPVGQAVAGMAGDLGTSLLTRGAIAAPGAIYNALSPQRRAGEYVAPLALGTETADEAALGINDAFSVGKENVDKAWDAYRQVPTQATTSSEPFKRLAAAQAQEMDLNPAGLPPVARNIDVLPENVGVADVQKVLSRTADTLVDPNAVGNTKRLASQFRDVAEQSLDEIEAASATDSAAVAALRKARSASKEFAKAFPDDSALFKAFIGRNAMDEPQEAFVKLLNSPKREQEMSLVLNAVRGNVEAERGIRRAVVQTVIGNTEELAGAGPTAALRRLDKIEGAARQALGEDGFTHLRRLLSEGATANRNRPWSVWGALGRGNAGGGVTGATIGSSLGYAAGGPTTAAAGGAIGGAIGSAASEIAHRLSPRAVREIAFRSLYDPALYRQITKPIPSGVKPAEWAATFVGSLVRRGILTKAEAKGEGEKP